MENEKITELYLSYNMLNYEFINARNYTYKACARRLCRFGFLVHRGYYCKRYRKIIWTGGNMNSWRGNINKIPPSGNWFTRQNSMISELDGETDTCLKQISNPMIIYLKSPKADI